jgi:hypothetical protein
MLCSLSFPFYLLEYFDHVAPHTIISSCISKLYSPIPTMKPFSFRRVGEMRVG